MYLLTTRLNKVEHPPRISNQEYNMKKYAVFAAKMMLRKIKSIIPEETIKEKKGRSYILTGRFTQTIYAIVTINRV